MLTPPEAEVLSSGLSHGNPQARAFLLLSEHIYFLDSIKPFRLSEPIHPRAAPHSLSSFAMLFPPYILSVFLLACTVFADAPPDLSEFCRTDKCAQTFLQHPQLSQRFCNRFKNFFSQTQHSTPPDSTEAPPLTPNHPVYTTPCFEAEDYSKSLYTSCNCLPKTRDSRPRKGRPPAKGS